METMKLRLETPFQALSGKTSDTCRGKFRPGKAQILILGFAHVQSLVISVLPVLESLCWSHTLKVGSTS